MLGTGKCYEMSFKMSYSLHVQYLKFFKHMGGGGVWSHATTQIWGKNEKIGKATV